MKFNDEELEALVYRPEKLPAIMPLRIYRDSFRVLGVVVAKNVGVLTEESTTAGIMAVYACIVIITFLSTTRYLYRTLEPRKPTT